MNRRNFLKGLALLTGSTMFPLGFGPTPKWVPVLDKRMIGDGSLLTGVSTDYIDKGLSDIALKYTPQGFVADSIFPTMELKNQKGGLTYVCK